MDIELKLNMKIISHRLVIKNIRVSKFLAFYGCGIIVNPHLNYDKLFYSMIFIF